MKGISPNSNPQHFVHALESIWNRCNDALDTIHGRMIDARQVRRLLNEVCETAADALADVVVPGPNVEVN